jgi:hypothetical protein
MSWLSLFWRSNKQSVLTDLANSLMDGKISKSELSAILFRVGLGVVDKGLPDQLKRAYALTDPDYLRNLGAKTVEEIIAKAEIAHSLLGTMIEEVK